MRFILLPETRSSKCRIFGFYAFNTNRARGRNALPDDDRLPLGPVG
jgi:hypothetical protein